MNATNTNTRAPKMSHGYGPFRVHPVADRFPLVGDLELRNLAESIRDDGQQVPIVVTAEGVLIDGRNRWRGCAMAGVEPDIEVRSFEDELEIARYIAAVNIHRRHLNESQRAMLGAELIEPMRANLPTGARPSEVVAELVNVSPRSVRTAEAILRTGVPELADAVRDGEARVHAAAGVAKLPEQEQRDVVAAGDVKGAGNAKHRADATERANALASANSSESNEHYTPRDIIEAARRTMGGIALDVASCDAAQSYINAGRYFTIADGGLEQDWEITEDEEGGLWMNCPYGRRNGKTGPSNQKIWTANLHAEYHAGKFPRACYEVNAYTGAEWFQTVWQAHAVCFIRGRLEHLVTDTATGELVTEGDPRHYSVIAYLGDDVAAFVREFSLFGFVVPGHVCAEFVANALSTAPAAAVDAA